MRGPLREALLLLLLLLLPFSVLLLLGHVPEWWAGTSRRHGRGGKAPRRPQGTWCRGTSRLLQWRELPPTTHVPTPGFVLLLLLLLQLGVELLRRGLGLGPRRSVLPESLETALAGQVAPGGVQQELLGLRLQGPGSGQGMDPSTC
jgi:hypothetical protein